MLWQHGPDHRREAAQHRVAGKSEDPGYLCRKQPGSQGGIGMTRGGNRRPAQVDMAQAWLKLAEQANSICRGYRHLTLISDRTKEIA